MGLFKFEDLPVNTLVGAGLGLLDKVTYDGKEVDRNYRTKYRLTRLVSAILTPMYKINDRKASRLPAVDGVEDPVFIIGHWRSGTTFIHNVLSKDPQFGYCSTYQTVFPHLMLCGRPFFRWCMKTVMPDSRPTDSLELNPDQPQEEEFAFTNMTSCSYYHFWMFPRHIAEYRHKYLLMEDLSADELDEFKRCQKSMIDTALHVSGKKRFLSKNPPHTGRVKELLELYPNAKFIYMMRNPFTVYKSTMSFIKNTIKTLQLQDISEDELERQIVETYSELYDKYESEKHLIPEGHLVEVRFEDFERDPLAEAEEIYAKLGLGDFQSVKPLMAAYVGEKKGFKKNKYQYDEHTVSTVREHWHKAVEQWGYEI